MKVPAVARNLITAMGVLVFSIPIGAAPQRVAASEPDSQQARTLERNVSVTMKYLLYLPDDYETQESWPLVLFLHGAGERGDALERVKTHGPPKLIAAGKSFPFVLVSPQCPRDRRWEPLELATLLDEIGEHYRIDEQRIHVTGLSMGGFGTFALAAYQPHRFAAIAPICGGGEPILARLISPVPAWVFHGAKDQIVPLERSQQMVDAMRRAGGEVKFTVYPEAGHDSWTETYANPELYQWLLEQKRPER